MDTPIDLSDKRIITVSGRIASGSTTLARKLAEQLGWRHMEGGEIFWEKVRGKLDLSPKDTNLRPDAEDELFDESLKKMLKEEKNLVLETKLAGFFAKDLKDVFKILVICEDQDGTDQTQIRIDRLVNREQLSIQDAKEEVITRENNDIEKWRRLYANSDPNWNYWNPAHYDLVVNTYFQDQEKSLDQAIKAIKNK